MDGAPRMRKIKHALEEGQIPGRFFREMSEVWVAEHQGGLDQGRQLSQGHPGGGCRRCRYFSGRVGQGLPGLPAKV